MVGPKLVEVVNVSQLKRKVARDLNATFIALIPKGEKSKSCNDCRPISLCNLVYKIISKIIANWLKPLMSRWMSQEQFGFLDNMHIMDVIGVARKPRIL